MSYRAHHAILFLCCLSAAFWPVWQWIFARVTDGTGDGWAPLSLLTAVFFVSQQRAGLTNRQWLWLPCLLLAVYLLGVPILPPLVLALIAKSTIAVTVSLFWWQRPCHLGIWGLMVMSLPIMASLQFYLGYPLRVVIGEIAVVLIRLSGFLVSRDGVNLQWHDYLVAIDAPCSGVKMLWAGFYLCFTLICFLRLKTSHAVLLITASTVSIILANALRASALFFTEAIFNTPQWMHSGIGIASFLFCTTVIIYVANILYRKSSCPLPTFS